MWRTDEVSKLFYNVLQIKHRFNVFYLLLYFNIKKFIQMKREEIIKETAKLMLKRSGLSQSIIAGHTSKGREITQLEHKELDLGMLSNYRLRKLYDEYKNS